MERLRPMMVRMFYPFATHLVAVSPKSAESIYQFTEYPKDIRVIRNGLKLEAIHQKANRPLSYPWLKCKDITLIVGIGRLSIQKNFSLLLKAFSQLENRQNVRLIILGDGPDLENLIALSDELNIRDYVDFPGFMENPFPILSRAGVFVLSSKWEGFANVVIEALACKVPIVATDCPGGPLDILAGKPFARIVPVDDPIAMARAIGDLLTTEVERAPIADYARNFDIRDIAQQYIDLINEIQ
jgi:glycosyltransferase involved in cell wall biosynthesis